MKRKGQSLHELASGFMTEFPQRITSIPVQEKVPLENLPEVSDVIHKAETELSETGRVMVRYSGTENKCRVLVEARDADKADLWSKNICTVIRKTLS
jgi:phosphoglucosamine mutase